MQATKKMQKPKIIECKEWELGLEINPSELKIPEKKLVTIEKNV